MENEIYTSLLKNVPVEKGDLLFVSSDLMKVVYFFMKNKQQFNPDIFIDVLIEKLGDTGTLVFPTYNWDFCKGVTFDYKKTPSKTGTLSVWALKRKDFRRSLHPIYSFAVCGRDKEIICSMKNKSSFGEDSPFAYFYKNNAKNLFIDVSYQHSATFVHYVEEKNNVPYRFLKDFTAGYIDENEEFLEKTYSMYVRYLDRKVETTINPMHEIFLEHNAVKDITNCGCLFRLLDMKKAYDLVEEDIIENASGNIAEY